MVFHNRCLWPFAPYISQLDILYPYNPPKHGHSEQFEHLSKSAAPTVKKISKVTLPIKRGVVILGHFAPDRDFGTYITSCSLESN